MYLRKITKQGTNQIEVHVTTGQLNSYIGRAKQGNTLYRQFKSKEDQLMSAVLIGPVIIRASITSQE